MATPTITPSESAGMSASSAPTGNQTSINTALSAQTNRGLHLFTAIATLLIAIVAFWNVPGLSKDAATTLSSAGTFLGLYGVLFAIIEVVRLRGVAVIAANAAQEARNAVQSAYSLRDAAECQSYIEFALKGVDAGDSVPSAALNNISKLYSAEFHVEMLDEDSSARRNVAMLQSYVNARRPSGVGATSSLKSTLMQMASELSQRGQRTISGRAMP